MKIKHGETGNVYEVISTTLMIKDREGNWNKGILYKSEEGKIYSRFYESKEDFDKFNASFTVLED